MNDTNVGQQENSDFNLSRSSSDGTLQIDPFNELITVTKPLHKLKYNHSLLSNESHLNTFSRCDGPQTIPDPQRDNEKLEEERDRLKVNDEKKQDNLNVNTHNYSSEINTIPENVVSPADISVGRRVDDEDQASITPSPDQPLDHLTLPSKKVPLIKQSARVSLIFNSELQGQGTANDQDSSSIQKRSQPQDLSKVPHNMAQKQKNKRFKAYYATSDSKILNISPGSISLLHQLFQQAGSLIKMERYDWINTLFDNLYIMILHLPDSFEFVQILLDLVKELDSIISQHINEQRLKDIMKKYKHILFLAEKVGDPLISLQIELNLLVCDCYLRAIEFEQNNFYYYDIMVSYANEAMRLAKKTQKVDQLKEIENRIDYAESHFLTCLLLESRYILKLPQLLIKTPKAYPRVINLYLTMMYQLLKQKDYEHVRNFIDQGLMNTCLASIEILGIDTCLHQLLLFLSQFNVLQLQSSSITDPLLNEQLIGCTEYIQASSQWRKYCAQLETLRSTVDIELVAQNLTTLDYMVSMIEGLNNGILDLLKSVFEYVVDLLFEPPIPFCIFALGSLSRKSAGLYSDLEYGIMLSEESECESTYWIKLWTVFEFMVNCFGERTGFHVDSQGNPKTSMLRGTPYQLANAVMQSIDEHSLGMTFSLLRPIYVFGTPNSKELFNFYITLINGYLEQRIDRENASPIRLYTELGCFFLENHLAISDKWMPPKGYTSLELKTNILQPLVYIVTDLALLQGSLPSSSTGSVYELVTLLVTTHRISHATPMLHLDFGNSIINLFYYVVGLRTLVQHHYREQFNEEYVLLVMDKKNPVSTTTHLFSPFVLTPEQCYWVEMVYLVVLRPLYYYLLPEVIDNWKDGVMRYNIDPVLDAMNQHTDHTKCTLENSAYNELIECLVATLVIRNSPLEVMIEYYEKLSEENQLTFCSALKQHLPYFKSIVERFNDFIHSYSIKTKRLENRPKYTVWAKNLLTFNQLQISAFIRGSKYNNVSTETFLYILRIELKTKTLTSYKVPYGGDSPSLHKEKRILMNPIISLTTVNPGSLEDELIIHSFFRHLDPSISTEFGLTHLVYGEKKFPLLLVDHVNGESIASVVQKRNMTRLGEISLTSFSQFFLASVVLMCSMNQQDLFLIPQDNKDNKSHRVYGLIRKLNFRTILEYKPMTLCDQHHCCLKVLNILFCFDNMHHSIDKVAANEFCSIDAQNLLDRWQEDLDNINQEINESFTPQQRLFLKELIVVKNPHHVQGQPLISVPDEYITTVHQRILKLQHYLNKHPNATHFDLLYQADLLVAHLYRQSFEQTITTNAKGSSLDDIIDTNPHLPTNCLDNLSLAYKYRQTHSVSYDLLISRDAISISKSPTPTPDTVPSHRDKSHHLKYPIQFIEPAGHIHGPISRLNSLASSNPYSLQIFYTINCASPKVYKAIKQLKSIAMMHDITSTDVSKTTPSLYHQEGCSDSIKYQPYTSTSSPDLTSKEPRDSSFQLKQEILTTLSQYVPKSSSSECGQFPILTSKASGHCNALECEGDMKTLEKRLDALPFELLLKGCPGLNFYHINQITSSEMSKKLTVIDLGGTDIKTSIVSLLINCVNVEYMNLSGCSIRHFYSENSIARNPISLKKLVWVDLRDCKNLKSIILEALELKHLNITGCCKLIEFRLLNFSKSIILGMKTTLIYTHLPVAKIFSIIPSASWYYETKLFSKSFELTLIDVALGHKRQLNLHSPFNKIQARFFGEIIKWSPLQHVDISDSGVTEEEAAIIFYAVLTNPLIETFNLCRTSVRKSCIEKFLEEIKRSTKKLKLIN